MKNVGANDKWEATFHGQEQQTAMYDQPDEEVVLDVNSIADMLCDQFQCYTEEGGNDLQGLYVDEVTMGGRVVTVDWSNGQRFQVEVYLLPSMDDA